MKDCYINELDKLKNKVEQCKGFHFCIVTDTHLDNSVDETAENIKEANNFANYQCLMHLGDFLNGSFPRILSKKILNDQMSLFRKCVDSFYPVEGNHDGFTDLSKVGFFNVSLDEDWYKTTSFTENDDKVCRIKGKPYYYIDFKEYNIRFIVLCTFYYEFGDDGSFNKVYGTDDEQVKWFDEIALDVEEKSTVLIFSHDLPFENFNKPCENNPRNNGNVLMDIVKKKQKEKNISVPAWFCGHVHGDYMNKINGINFILVGSQTAYVPQLWDMPKGGEYAQRNLGTASEDLWDSVVIDIENKKINIFRFGAGNDRELEWE